MSLFCCGLEVYTEFGGDPKFEAHGVSSAQVILRWNLQKGVVVISGSSNPDHIQENAELYDFEYHAYATADNDTLYRIIFC